MPASPLPNERSRVPSLIPGGILSLTRLNFSTRPSPRHFRHGFSIISPPPRHRGHVCEIWKNPRELTTWPRPPQVGQLVLREPGSAPLPWHLSQASSFSISICLSAPKAASSNLISMSYRRSDPRRRSSERAPAPPPKNVSKIPPPNPPPPKTSRKISNGS